MFLELFPDSFLTWQPYSDRLEFAFRSFVVPSAVEWSPSLGGAYTIASSSVSFVPLDTFQDSHKSNCRPYPSEYFPRQGGNRSQFAEGRTHRSRTGYVKDHIYCQTYQYRREREKKLKAEETRIRRARNSRPTQ